MRIRHLAVAAAISCVLQSQVGADTSLFDFAATAQRAQWHGDLSIDAIDPSGLSLRFEKTGVPAWACWSFDEDWEEFEKLLIEMDADGLTVLGLALSDDSDYLVGMQFDLEKGRNQIIVPLKEIFAAGLQIAHMRGIALWSRGNPTTITLRKIALEGEGVDLSEVLRHGTRMLTDAEDVGANFVFYYSHDAGRVRATGEHVIAGKRSFRMDFPKGGKITSWGRVPHDWRGYDRYALDLYNPQDEPVTLILGVWDSHVPFISERYIANREVVLPPMKTTTLEWKLAGLEGESIRAPRGKLKQKFIQAVRFDRDAGEKPFHVYVDNLRLIGAPGKASERQIPRDEIPSFGFEHNRERLALPDLKKIEVPGEPSGVPALRIGAARVKITPPVGTVMATDKSISEAVLDDIYARALLLQQEGRDPVVWLHVDHTLARGQNEIPPVLAERLGIRPGNIFWSSTHNHSSGSSAKGPFLQQIIDGLIEASETASKSMRPVRICIAKTHAKLNYNRVIAGPDGKFPGNLYEAKYLNCLRGNRPADDELAAIWFVGADGKPVAGVVSYTAHANMMCRVAPVISGDWPGWAERFLERASGAVVMVVNGAEGDVDMRGNAVSIDRTIAAGWNVAHAAARATRDKLDAVDPTAFAGVAVLHGEGKGSPNTSEVEKEITEHTLRIDILVVGAIAFVDPRGELWNRFGREIKERSPLPHTYLNQSCYGYFPEPYAFEEKLYGTWNRRPDWGGTVRDTAVRILNETGRK